MVNLSNSCNTPYTDRTLGPTTLFDSPGGLWRCHWIDTAPHNPLQYQILRTVNGHFPRKPIMRIFNTSGPCDPEKHYTVMREELVTKGQLLVEQGRYFTIFAPRQAGKTTYFQLLFRHLATHGYTPVWISFEGLKTLTRDRFYKALHHLLQREFDQQGIRSTQEIADAFDAYIIVTNFEKPSRRRPRQP